MEASEAVSLHKSELRHVLLWDAVHEMERAQGTHTHTRA
jgi:hypothetical protein